MGCYGTDSHRNRPCPPRILDGKALAQDDPRPDSPARSPRFRSRHGVVPGLTVVLVGDDPASQVYVRNKQNACKAAGMNGAVLRLPADDRARRSCWRPIDRLNADPARPRHPGPAPLAEGHRRTCRSSSAIDPLKDVDGFHPATSGCWRRAFPGSSLARRWESASCCSHAQVETRGCARRGARAGRRSSASRWPCCCSRRGRGATPRSRSATRGPATRPRSPARPTS